MADFQTDVLIVGGGLIGASLMHALAPTGLQCMLVDHHDLQQSPNVSDLDVRSVALSAASVRILRNLHLWHLIEPTAAVIQRIHISDQGHFGSACLESEHGAALGHVVDIQVLNQVLHQAIDPQKVLAPAKLIAFDAKQRTATLLINDKPYTIEARLFVAADGSDSMMRSFCGLTCQTKVYAHHALVANIGLARSHQHTAYERFTTTGPLALLPLGPQRMALVWSLLPEEAERLLQVTDAVFLKELSLAFGYRLGRLVKVGRRKVYPLRQLFMTEQVHDSVVFIGNAAHTLHPVAGQGGNLGLRDVAMLAQCITQYGLDDPDVFTQYRQSRSQDHAVMTSATDGLIELYTHQNKGMICLRQTGLIMLDNSRMMKRLLSRYASGLAGIVPDLVCDIPL